MSGLSLKKHQVHGAEFCLKHKYNILAMDTGTGKTLTALRAWELSGAEKLLIICPAGLVLNWKQEIHKWYGDKYIISVFLKGANIYPVWDTDITIVSYDLGKKAEYLIEWCNYLVFDEAQELKSLLAKRTEYYHKAIYVNSVPRVSLLTATPIQNRVEEFYSLIAICCYSPEYRGDFLKKFPDPETFADYFSYRREQTIWVGGSRRKIVTWTGYRKSRVKELKGYLKPIYYRVKFEDVYDLEPIVFKDILMSEIPDRELEKEYNKLSELYGTDGYASANAKRKRESAIEKVPFTIKYVENLISRGYPVIVYSDHIEACEKIAAHFKVPALTGNISGKERWKHAFAFQNGRGMVLAATIKALSTGHNLTRSHNIVLNDENWVPGVMDQVFGRIRRLGQKYRCVVHRIFGSPQDQAISDNAKSKRRTIKAVC